MARKHTHTVRGGLRVVKSLGFNKLARANRHNYAKGVRLAGQSHKKGSRR